MKPERSVTDGIFRHQLEGFQKYPVKRDSRFLEVFNECVVSVGHAQAVAESFQGLMPTLEEIRDVARSLRRHYLYPVPPQALSPPVGGWTSPGARRIQLPCGSTGTGQARNSANSAGVNYSHW